MNIVDAVIIVLILSFGVFGAKNGFFKEAVFLITTILSFILAYYFKDYLANFLSYTLPFFKFDGLSSLNILMYQMISFLIILSLLGVISGLLIKFAKFFEKLLNATIILGIPSKILGFLLGLVYGYVIVFVLLFILNQPFINLDIVNDSKLKEPIVNSSLVLSNIVEKTNSAIKEIYYLVDDYNKDKDKDEFNRNSVDIMLDKKIIKVSYVEKLIDLKKLDIPNINRVLDKYR